MRPNSLKEYKVLRSYTYFLQEEKKTPKVFNSQKFGSDIGTNE